MARVSVRRVEAFAPNQKMVCVRCRHRLIMFSIFLPSALYVKVSEKLAMLSHAYSLHDVFAEC